MEPSQNKIIVIPNRFTASQRVSIGNDIINFIQDRTSSGLDINGNLFAAYSKEYEKSGTPDLRFSGNMMSDLEVISHGKGFITIGFSNRDSNDKAGYLQRPTGQKSSTPKRRFVGISAKDLKRITDRY